MKNTNVNTQNEKVDLFEKFEAEKLKTEEMYAVTGGCTCGTVSSCHIDGTNDGDGSTAKFITL